MSFFPPPPLPPPPPLVMPFGLSPEYDENAAIVRALQLSAQEQHLIDESEREFQQAIEDSRLEFEAFDGL